MVLKALTPAPAPWTYYPTQNVVGDASGILVARLVMESQVDGKLIAAAPELLELAKLCREIVDDSLEERAPRHSLGALHARLKNVINSVS